MALAVLDPLVELVGSAPAFERVLERLPVIARSQETVLVRGETGTGKALVARSIHRLGPAADGPFVALHCGSLPDPDVESELAEPTRSGGRTVFLDEVETLTPRAQLVLLRVLSDDRPAAETRFIAATNAALERRVEQGSFRADLYYRLCVFALELPPLRDRREDILPLATHFLRRHQAGAPSAARLSGAAEAALLAYDWPGNVRELESAMLRGARLAKGGVIEPGDCGLSEAGARPGRAAAPQPARTYRELKRMVLDSFDREYLTRLMTEHRGNVSRAARAAGKERRDLGKLLKRHGFDPRSFT